MRQIGELRAQDLGQCRRRAPRRRRQQAAALAADLFGQCLEYMHHRGFVPRRQRRRAAHQQGSARAGQGAEAGERRAAPGQPVVVHRVQAADQGQHVAAAKGVMFGHHHHIPVAGTDARVEDLHHLAAARTKYAQRAGGLAATADRQRGRIGGEGCQSLAVAVHITGQAPRCQPAPWRPGLQDQGAVGALAQRRGQRDRLPDIAGTAVGDRPRRARSFHHWH